MKRARSKSSKPIKPVKLPRGRPREFDRDAALHKALELFWRRGYEGTSVGDLVAAMRITPPSLYAAFGSKEALYREALNLYLKIRGGFVSRALTEEPTAKAAVARALHDAARSFAATAATPPGCMVSIGVLTCAPEHQKIAADVAALRLATTQAVALRLERARAEGEIAPGVDTRSLARFYAAVIHGMCVQSRDGASVNDLAAIAETALDAWPRE